MRENYLLFTEYSDRDEAQNIPVEIQSSHKPKDKSNLVDQNTIKNKVFFPEVLDDKLIESKSQNETGGEAEHYQ